MKIITTTTVTRSQKDTIIYLWNREYPKKLNVTCESFDEFLDKSTDHMHFLLIDDADEIIGWACTFNREDDRWFSIIMNSLYQGVGLGRKMIDQLKQTEERLNGWVIDHDNEIRYNGEPYKSPLTFYLKNGFLVYPEIRFESEKMSAVKIAWRKG